MDEMTHCPTAHKWLTFVNRRDGAVHQAHHPADEDQTSREVLRVAIASITPVPVGRAVPPDHLVRRIYRPGRSFSITGSFPLALQP